MRLINPYKFTVLLLLPLTIYYLLGDLAFASSSSSQNSPDLTQHFIGYFAISIFVLAYALVMAEEFTHLRKSKPVILAAGIIWVAIAIVYARLGIPHTVEQAVRHNILEYAELMLFLLAAMTYINVMEERGVFETLRAWLINKNFSYRKLFWLTGVLSFFISPIADNLTTALIMCAVVMAVGVDSPRFVSLSCVNIVVASNAGGAFSPFGDITTLMVWQKGVVDFWTFFLLFFPSVVNFVVPAAFMHFAVPKISPEPTKESYVMRRGAKRTVVLFLLTIATAVSFHNFFDLPPVLGMMTGLGYLQLFTFYLKKSFVMDSAFIEGNTEEPVHTDKEYDIFRFIARAEWDTLLFFYGVVLCVGGLGFIGYLSLASEILYVDWGPTTANVLVGVLSAIVDNIPMMFAVLSMEPDMSTGQWLLVTLTAGVGGSMLSIGSAAGVALMGQARGIYTFFSHLRWAPVIALGYTASILAHQWINSGYF